MSSAIAAGAMDQRVQLLSPATGTDALGQPTTGWVDQGTVWAQAQPLRGREFIAATAAAAEAPVRFRMRYRADVGADWRLVWRGVAHAISAPPMDVDGGRHTLEIMATAKGVA